MSLIIVINQAGGQIYLSQVHNHNPGLCVVCSSTTATRTRRHIRNTVLSRCHICNTNKNSKTYHT